MKKIIFTISLVLFIFCFSCTKQKDTLAPSIELISPKEYDTLTSEKSEYSIQFKAKDNKGLSEEFISISDTNGIILSSEYRKIYGTVYNYSNTFIFGGTPNQIKKIMITIKIEDEARNTAYKAIPFYIKL
jgi:hypothetical protein